MMRFEELGERSGYPEGYLPSRLASRSLIQGSGGPPGSEIGRGQASGGVDCSGWPTFLVAWTTPAEAWVLLGHLEEAYLVVHPQALVWELEGLPVGGCQTRLRWSAQQGGNFEASWQYWQ